MDTKNFSNSFNNVTAPRSKVRGKPYKMEKYGNVSVPIYRSKVHGRLRYQVCWREGGKRCVKQRTDEAEAVGLAKSIARRLAEEGLASHRVVSPIAYEALRRLGKLAGAEPIAFLSELEAAKADMQGASWSQVARFWKDHAPQNFEEKLVTDVYEQYKESIVNRPQKARSGMKSKLNKFVTEFGRAYIGSITPKNVEDWFHRLPGSKAYGNKILAEVTTFFRKAQKWGYLPDGTVAPLKVDKHRVERKEPSIFTVEKAREVLNRVRDDCVPYVAIGLFGGLRPFELACPGQEKSLRWDDIDFDRGYIRVRAEVDGKNLTARYVRMSENLVAWLLPHRQIGGKVAMTRAAVKVSEDLRKKGVIERWEMDIMRHSFCSYLLAKEQNITHVAEQAGNSPEMIKKHYRRPLTQEEGDAWFDIRPGEGEAVGEEAGAA